MILVTGARGFVGRRLQTLLTQTRTDFRALEGDVRDRTAVAAQAAGASAIVHLAYRNLDRDGQGFESNVEGARVVADVARANRVRVIGLSSTGVYGHAAHQDADEDTPLQPDTALSRSRAEADRILLELDDVLVLRPRFVYGEGDRFVLPRIHAGVRRSPFWVDGGRARLSLVWVDDLAGVLLRAATTPSAERVLHVTDGTPLAFRELANALRAEWGGAVPHASIPSALMRPIVRSCERLFRLDPETFPLSSVRLDLVTRDQTFSTSRLRTWWPEVAFTPFVEALRRSASWYATQRG